MTDNFYLTKPWTIEYFILYFYIRLYNYWPSWFLVIIWYLYWNSHHILIFIYELFFKIIFYFSWYLHWQSKEILYFIVAYECIQISVPRRNYNVTGTIFYTWFEFNENSNWKTMGFFVIVLTNGTLLIFLLETNIKVYCVPPTVP